MRLSRRNEDWQTRSICLTSWLADETKPAAAEKVRVHELARELGWTSGQLLDELRRRGEFAKSASSVLEAPVVRAIRAEFAAVSEDVNPEASIDPKVYGGHSAEGSVVAQGSTDTFAAALARARTRFATRDAARAADWRPPILQLLLEEIVIPQRPEHLEKPRGAPHFRWELKKAERRCWSRIGLAVQTRASPYE